MAGRRKTRLHATPRRPVRQYNFWRGRIAAAATSEQLFDTAARWLRAVAAYLPPDQRTEALNKAGRWLATEADELARKR